MTKNWFIRLREAIEADPRKMRQISREAGFGVNYVQQMLRDEKEPGTDHLARLLEVLGQRSALYVLMGVQVSEDDEEFLRIASSLPRDLKADALRFFRTLEATANAGAPSADPPAPDDTKS